jgi:hypothetical protein
MRQAAGATDTGNGNGFLRLNLRLPANPVHCRQDAVVAATGTPTRLGAAIIVSCEISILELEGPVTF